MKLGQKIINSGVHLIHNGVKLINKPIVTTSVNINGSPSLNDVDKISSVFKINPDFGC